MLGGASAVALPAFLFVFFSRPLAYLSIAGLVAASVLNVWLRMESLQRSGRTRKGGSFDAYRRTL